MNLTDRIKHSGGAELCPPALAYLSVCTWTFTRGSLDSGPERQPSIDLHVNRVCRLSISWFYEAAHTQIIVTSDSARCDRTQALRENQLMSHVVLRIYCFTSFGTWPTCRSLNAIIKCLTCMTHVSVLYIYTPLASVLTNVPNFVFNLTQDEDSVP